VTSPPERVYVCEIEMRERLKSSPEGYLVERWLCHLVDSSSRPARMHCAAPFSCFRGV